MAEAQASEPARLVYAAAVADIEQSLAVAAQGNGLIILSAGRPAYRALGHLRDRWRTVENAAGDDGRKARLAIALDAARDAIAVHESLPGAPPAPEWLVKVTRTDGSLGAPPPALSLVDEVKRQASAVGSGLVRLAEWMETDVKRPIATAIAITAGVVVLGLVWSWTRPRS